MKKIPETVDAVYRQLSELFTPSDVLVRYEFSCDAILQPLAQPYVTVGLGGVEHTAASAGTDTVMQISVRVFMPQQWGARSAFPRLDLISQTLLANEGAVSFTVQPPKHNTPAGAVEFAGLLRLEFPAASE